ncbi:MAG: polysulfide reductase NrfD [Bacteroidales bacterium]|nr:polysulfide reductase NrfD [Bacteroidales bacterium]
MKEEIFISGRNLPMIDPNLTAWGWEIGTYLFVGGLSAGILIFAALYTILKKENEYPTAVKWAPFLAPILLSLGLGALFIDLHHKLYFWKLYTTIRLESPMSWGAWTLMVITPLSILYSASYLKELIPSWNWFGWKSLNNIEKQVIKMRPQIAWVLLISGIILGIYTGILLSAFNARPLWNTSILGPLFLASGLSAGAATIMLMSKNAIERKMFSRIDLLMIAIELFLIIHMFMGLQAGSAASIEAANLFLGGQFTLPFWIFVVGLGLIIPGILEVLELRGKHIPVFIPAVLILLGGLAFRFIMVEAGQITRYLY